MKRLAIITTHPIQYYAPVFKLLQTRGNISIKVFYTWGKAALQKYDPGFGREVAWDIPLLEGYPYEWVENISVAPGSHHFKGIVNPSLNKKITECKPDAVLVFGWAYFSHLKALLHFKNKIPVLFRGDSTLLDKCSSPKEFFRLIFLKWVYRHVDYVLYPGINARAYFKKHGLKEKQLILAPHAVDNDRFAQKKEQSAKEIRNSLGIADQETLILFAGKLEEKKDPVLLLNSFLALNQPGCHLLFAGNGMLEQALKSKSAGCSNIHFINFQNQAYMPVIYQACDLFCLPSKGPNETWGLAVNEAMAAGKAVVVSDKTGCAADLVKNDYNGYLFKNGSEQALTDVLRKITTSKDVQMMLGKNSAAIISEWSFTKIALAIENIILNEPYRPN
jgi:glycosyltransferase involved in cell wall biosynthesis